MRCLLPTRYGSALLVCALTVFTLGCRRDMQDQPRYEPLRASRFFADGRSARPTPEGTVARDELNTEDSMHTGLVNGAFMLTMPVPVTKATLLRGQERFDIFCSPCHGRLGDGDGMIARRGLKYPANLHTDRLRQAPPGYMFQVISHGYGAMMDYDEQIDPPDRWAIVAYIHALQLSRNASIRDLAPNQQARLEAKP